MTGPSPSPGSVPASCSGAAPVPGWLVSPFLDNGSGTARIPAVPAAPSAAETPRLGTAPACVPSSSPPPSGTRGRSGTPTGRSSPRRWSSIPGSSLTATRSANAGQPAITRPTGRRCDVRGPARRRPGGQRGPRQRARPAPGAPVGQQHQRGHDLDAVHRQRERVRLPPRLPCAAASSCMCCS
jgi:hypothetical protein